MSSPPPKGGYRYYVTGMLGVAFTFNFMDRQILGILAEPVKAEFQLGDTQMGLLIGTSFALFYTFVGIAVARLADRGNRVAIISISTGLWSVMTAVCGLAVSYWQLFIARMLVGVGEAGLGPAAHSVISDYFGKHERARALAIYSLGTPVGQLCAILIGGTIGHVYGWRTAFIVVGLPGLVLALLIAITVKEPPRGAQDDALPVLGPVVPFAVALKDLLARRVFVLAAAGHVLTALFGFAIAGWVSPHFQRAFGLSLQEMTPLVAAVILVGGIPGMIIGGLIADRLAKRSLGWLVRAPALFALAAFPLYILGLNVTDKGAATVLLGLGTFCFQASFAAPLSLIQHVVPADRRALAASVVFFMSNLIGLGLGPLLVGGISDAAGHAFGPSSLTPGLCLVALAFPLAAWAFYRAEAHLEAA